MKSEKPSRRVFTVDLEEYFQVEAFADVVPRDRWDSYPSRLADSTRLLLDLLDDTGTTCTFFVLGWNAQRHGSLIREIARRGHELACHSYWHRLAYHLTRREFAEDLLLSKDVIEQAAGVAVRGYRAPSFSVTRDALWVLNTLSECGLSYDSSIFPIHHDIYGIPEASRRPFQTSNGLTVIPMTTFRWCRRTWPVAGGAYLRLLPWWYTRTGIMRAESEDIPVVSYVHPWELDPEQPRIRGRTRSAMRHYTGLDKTEARLRTLLGLGGFSCFRDSGLTNGLSVVGDVTAGHAPLPDARR